MAMNHADGQMYVMEQKLIKNSWGSTIGTEMNLYTMDLASGELTKQYEVKVANPSGSSYTKLAGLVIDDEGNFYGVGAYMKGYAYLFTWTNDMAVDGVIENLVPINNTEDGSTGVDSQYGQLAWDHDNKVLYLVGNDTKVPDTVNCLWILDTETGKASPASEYTGEYKSDVYPSSLYCVVKDLFVVPSHSPALTMTEEAASIALDKDHVSMLEGMSVTLTAELMPWSLTDRSLTWTSSDPSVVTVKNGRITGAGVGTATVTVTTNAEPHLEASCEVTVKPMPDLTLTGVLYDSDGTPYWVDFNAEKPDEWVPVSSKLEEDYYGGTLFGETIFVHNGDEVIGVEADSFVPASYGEVQPGNYWETSVDWKWTDAAAAPVTEDGYFGHLVALVSGKQTVEVLTVDEENHTVKQLRTQNLAYTAMGSELPAAIAYAGSGIYHANWYGDCPASYFYIITESGKLYQWISYTSNKGSSYSSEVVYVGATGLSLTGASDLTQATSASMYYDAESGYLFLTANPGSGETTRLYLIDAESLMLADAGHFGSNVWPVTTLFRFGRNTNLRLEISEETLELYAGETVQLSAKTKPASYRGGVTWSSSDEAVATVDGNGVITGVAAGTAVITATSVDTNEAGEHVTVSAAVTVKALTQVDATVHAQITTEEGPKWVTVNTADLSYTVDGDADMSANLGGGVHDGRIYFTGALDGYYGKICEVDPSNEYARTEGGSYYSSYAMLDAATAPAITVGEGEEAVARFDFLLFLTKSSYNYQYIECMEDYTQGDSGFKSWYRNFSDLGAIAYAGQTEYMSESGDRIPAQAYYVLGGDGTLYQFVVSDTTIGYDLSYSNIGFGFDDYTALSMTMVQVDGSAGLLIADSSKGAADLYYVKLAEELTCEKVGRLAGALGISTLYTDEDLAGEAVESDIVLAENRVQLEEASAGMAESLAAEAEKEAQEAEAAENAAQETEEEVSGEAAEAAEETAAEPEAAEETATEPTEAAEEATPEKETEEEAPEEAAEESSGEMQEPTGDGTAQYGQVRGSLNSIDVKSSRNEQQTDGVIVDADKKTVTVNVTADASTNGLFALSYDTEVLTLQSVKSMYLNSWNASEGTVTFAYADRAEINDLVTTLIFTYEESTQDRITELKVTTREDGAATPGTEATTEVELPGVADKTKLQELYDANTGRAESDYTADSWKAFAEAYANAGTVLADPDATQEEVDAALAALQNAVDHLKRAEPNSGDGQNNGSASGANTGDTTSH